MAWRAGARCNRRVEAVNVDGDVVAFTCRDALKDVLDAELAELPHRENIGTHAACVFISFARRGGDIANADLRQAGDIGSFSAARRMGLP